MFKVGDKVKCINIENLYGFDSDICLDDLYTVREINIYGQFITLEESKDHLGHPIWSPHRFKLSVEEDDFSNLDLSLDI